MTTQEKSETIGYFTSFYLRQVEGGFMSAEDLQFNLDVNNRITRGDGGVRYQVNHYISLQETLALLRQREKGTKLAPRALMALMREYQADIADISADPKRWANTYLSPERARAWYEEQIEMLREQLRGVAAS